MSNVSFSEMDLLDRLQKEYGYPSAGAKSIAERLVKCTPLIKEAFWHWWQTGELNLDMQVGEYTVSRLIQEHQMKPIAALLTMDWLAREPDKAILSLKRGHDHIKPETKPS